MTSAGSGDVNPVKNERNYGFGYDLSISHFNHQKWDLTFNNGDLIIKNADLTIKRGDVAIK